MKLMKKLMVVFVALFMVMSMTNRVEAAELPVGTAGEDKTITITTPDGLAADDEVTYTVYKVFDATTNGTSISYKSLDGTAPTGFVVDDANNVYLGTTTDAATGNEGEIVIKVGGATKYIVPSTAATLTPEQITAITTYTGKVEVGTVTITGPKASKTVTVPDFGYYYITTTTGTVVSIDSTNKSAAISDKNSVPQIDKKITGASSYDTAGKNAIAQVGTKVNYEVKITVGKGAKNYVFHDKMDSGLSYNNDVAVTPKTDASDPAVTIVKNTETASGDTLTVTFNDGIKEGTVITITYSATVTSDALQDDPANNTASIDYGNNYNSDVEEDPAVYNAKFTVTKQDGDGQPLAGAGFVIAQTVADTSEGAAEGATKTVYYTFANNTITWVDSIDAADVHRSDAQGAVPAFTGLGNGTYTLIEKVVPEGYNKAADETFTVADANVTPANLKQTATVTNEAGAVLPSTGGIGTTIFYVLGSALVLGAGVILVAKKRING